MKRNLIVSMVLLIVLGIVWFSTNGGQTPNQQQSTEITFSETDAIAKAKENLGISSFPDKPGKVAGVIYGGGPAPGIKVPGEFETRVEKSDRNSYTVVFTESWNAEDFHYTGQSGPVLSHFFKYMVTSGDVQLIDSGGDFPPQWVK